MAWWFPDEPRSSTVVHRPDPGMRLREIATTLWITERDPYGIVTDLVEAEYVLKDKHGRPIAQVDKPLPEVLLRSRPFGQRLDLPVHTEEATRDHATAATSPDPRESGCVLFMILSKSLRIQN